MQRRHSDRIPVNMPAIIILGGRSYNGHVINVSEDGIGSAVTASIDAPQQFVPVNNISLHFNDPSGNRIELSCELAWFSRKNAADQAITIGMRIINPPPLYRSFVQSLYDSDLRQRSKDRLITELIETRRKLAEAGSACRPLQSDDFLSNRDVCHALVESTEDSIYIVDSECRYQYVNPTHLSRLGLSLEECIGRPYRDFHSTGEVDEFAARVRAVIESGISVRYEQKNSRDGKYYLRTLGPIADSDGKIRAVTVISKNITDRKLAEELLVSSKIELEKQVMERTAAQEALNNSLNREISERRHTEEALKKSSEDWRVTFDSTKDMMLMVDDSFRIIRVNRATSEFLGLPFNQIIGRSVFDLFTGMDISQDLHPLNKIIRSKKHEEAEIYFRNRDLWVLASADPIMRDSNSMTGAVHIVRDITEHKNLQMQLLQAQKMESIGRLAGGVAHDFNNLLSAIIGYTELTLMKLPEVSTLRDYLLTVKSAGEKAAELTQRLLAFSRKQLLKMQPVNLNSILQNMVNMLSRMVMEDISLELHTAPSIRTIMADRVQVEQILMNLIVNARDAMPNGGKLIIETADVDLDRKFAIKHENVQPGKYVLLSVSDTGIGMSSKVQQRIFEPFFTTKGIGEGTGLGLATVYGIVKQHNGYIYVYSEISKGTTFKIYLPAASEDVAEEAAKENIQLPEGKESILVVDDDASIRNLIKDVLQPLGYELFLAGSGNEALEIVGKNPKIEVLLTDIVMPNMNGRELADKILRKHPGIKVIFMSGYTNEAITQQGILREADLLIQKPLSPARLTGRLREILSAKEN